MAKRIFTTGGLTYTATAAGAAVTTLGFMGLRGGGATQLIDVLEIFFSGKVGTSTVIGLVAKRSSTIATTPSTLTTFNSDGPLFPNTTALSTVAVSFVTASGLPVSSSAVTDATLQLGLNGFGGIVRWNAAPQQQWQIIGNTTPGGETVIFNSSSHGGVSCAGDGHCIYEPY